MTHEEFVRKFNNLQYSSAEQNVFNEVAGDDLDVSALPKSVDLREKGHVTAIKDQNPCGTCWSFSAVASLESAHFKKTGNLVSLSEQNIVECTTSDAFGYHFKHTCNGFSAGGLPKNGINYAISNGIETEESYPYSPERLRTDYECQFSESKVAATFTDIESIPSGSEAALQKALADVGTVVSVGIDARQPSFQFYRSGVYNDPICSSVKLDHGVAVVGYGTTENGEDYWIVKNSWGTRWGEDGYIKIARNENNKCGVATNAVYAIA